jgi:predicted DNA-binding protein (MmcQ/YjbR family)
MNSETIRDYVLQFEGVTEGFPFGESTLVFKVNEKIFLLMGLDASPLQFNVKCDPDRAIELREEYPEHILPGYHMNKKHWNTIIVDGTLPVKLVKEMIADSYGLVKGKGKSKK